MEIKNLTPVPIAPIDVLDILATTQQMNIRYLANQQSMVVNPGVKVDANAETQTTEENNNGSGGNSSGGIVTN